MLIGITGRGGSGKSTVARLIKKYNPDYEYIEVDLLIEKYVLNSQRLLNKVNLSFNDKRYIMKDIVMSYFKFDKDSKKIHQMFVDEVERVLIEKINLLSSENIIIDWFLLHELKLFERVDIKVLTHLNREERIKRVMKRSKTKDIEEFIEVDNYYNENFNCQFDYVIDTSGDNYIEENINLFNKVKKL